LFVGSLRLKLLINGSRTLKDKRQVVRSILDTVRSRRNVAWFCYSKWADEQSKRVHGLDC